MGDVFSPSYKIKARTIRRDRDGDDSRIKIINQTIHITASRQPTGISKQQVF